MNFTPVTVSKVVKKMFPNFIWNIGSQEKTLYLTFDDGPTPEITEWVLACLNKHQAKATFFCIGENIEQHPEIFQNIVINGHAIGNHTFSHLKGWKTKTKDYVENTRLCDRILKIQIQKSEIANQKSSIINLFRPPYGRMKPKQAKLLIDDGFQIVMWSILSVDWDKNVAETQCYNNVINNAISGDIVVFHDSIKASKNLQYALPRVLEYYNNLGYKFKRIPELGQ
jgi:peptidoglycan/xylan/chitin deacetylase (PgdA/CDA1 family)